jgi:hypothetical protein
MSCVIKKKKKSEESILDFGEKQSFVEQICKSKSRFDVKLNHFYELLAVFVFLFFIHSFPW